MKSEMTKTVKQKPRKHKKITMTRVLLTLDDKLYKKLETLAKTHYISVPNFIRSVIIPEWLKTQEKRK